MQQDYEALASCATECQLLQPQGFRCSDCNLRMYALPFMSLLPSYVAEGSTAELQGEVVLILSSPKRLQLS